MVDVNRIVATSYIVIQVIIALFISIVGAIHVRRYIHEERQQIGLSTAVELNKTNTETGDNRTDNEEDVTDNKNNTKQKGFFQLWAKTIWKMRSVYGGLAVHCFDVLTDILVIMQWLELDDVEDANINPQTMAYCGIVVVVGSKIISSIAIFLKEGSLRRAALQFVDLLIFEEIHETHQKIISQIKNRKSINEEKTAIESTLSFKYVRNFEAVFEAIPQSVLQLVFILRDPNADVQAIFIISIIQSIISMTNSIINNDYTQMQEDRWKRYKQRLPPTHECFRHALSRLCEVAYRIGLLALFWCVCGGLAFGIMLAVELLLILARMRLMIWTLQSKFNGDTILLNLNSLVVIPSEMVYSGMRLFWFKLCDVRYFPLCLVLNLCCCVGLAAFVVSLGPNIFSRHCYTKVYPIPTVKIGTSFMQLIFMIFYGVFSANGARKRFLLSPDHGLYIFIATCVCFLIYTQYLLFVPNFGIPQGINVRSKWGYAFGNELRELKKVNVKFGNRSIKRGILEIETEKHKYVISTTAQFWDEPFVFVDSHPMTAAVFALANENYDIVHWLEEQGAVAHKGMDALEARRLVLHNDNIYR